MALPREVDDLPKNLKKLLRYGGCLRWLPETASESGGLKNRRNIKNGEISLVVVHQNGGRKSHF